LPAVSSKTAIVEDTIALEIQKDSDLSNLPAELAEMGEEEATKSSPPKRKRSQVRKRSNRGKKPQASSATPENTSA